MIFERHAFSRLDEEFKQLQAMLVQMQDYNLKLLAMLQEEVKHIEQRYPQAKAFDKEINALEHQVDRIAAGLLSKFTLLGTELRFTLSVFKMAYILECIADNMKNCMKRLSKLKATPPESLTKAVTAMTEATRWPLEQCLSIIVNFDDKTFQKLLDQKKDLGALYRTALTALQQLPGETLSGDDMAEMHLIIRNVERISDLIADSAKMSYFIHTGEKYEKPV